MDLNAIVGTTNIADSLDSELLSTIGSDAIRGYQKDLATCEEWFDQVNEWTKLAKQISEPKSFPWQNASNVKYPLLSTAAIQFSARAYPALLPSHGKIVKSILIGKDPEGQKTEIADAVSLYMSYQLMNDMVGWEEDMDRLLIMLPITGTLFKKTYYDSQTKKNCSKLIYPDNLIVNYWSKSLHESERISEVFELSPRKIKERQNTGVWLTCDLGSPTSEQNGEIDETTPFEFIEQHTFLDLDGDDYPEPYVVTVETSSSKVVRIVPRFYTEDIHYHTNEKGEEVLSHIVPTQYYTKYTFVPNPDGGFYDIGFGQLLGPLNESVNTLINQLIDAGTLSNLQSGFLGKGLKLKGGEQGFRPGEWKPVPVTGDDLRKQIVPLPAKDPSNVLFQLMGSLITSGKELASVAEIFVGKMPGQNTPATTTMATIEQGMKVFTAVYKRIYRSLAEEFQKLYKLNSLYLDESVFIDILDIKVDRAFFNKDQNDIMPAADPTAASNQEKLMRAQGLLELLPTGVLDPVEVVRRILEAQEQPEYEKLFNQAIQQTGQAPQAPDPKGMEMEMKGKLEQQKYAMQAEDVARKGELASRSTEQQLAMKQQSHAMDMQQKQQLLQVKAAEMVHKQRIFSVQQAQQFKKDSSK